MCFYCYCTDDEEKVQPIKRIETPEKLIQRVIMEIKNYSECLFQVIVYSFFSEQFLYLTGTGFLFVQMAKGIFSNPDLHAIIVYRITCVHTKELLFTNKYEIFGKLNHVDLDTCLT